MAIDCASSEAPNDDTEVTKRPLSLCRSLSQSLTLSLSLSSIVCASICFSLSGSFTPCRHLRPSCRARTYDCITYSVLGCLQWSAKWRYCRSIEESKRHLSVSLTSVSVCRSPPLSLSLSLSLIPPRHEQTSSPLVSLSLLSLTYSTSPWCRPRAPLSLLATRHGATTTKEKKLKCVVDNMAKFQERPYFFAQNQRIQASPKVSPLDDGPSQYICSVVIYLPVQERVAFVKLGTTCLPTVKE